MPRPITTALVLGTLCLPLVVAAAPALVGAQIAGPYIRERDALPAFDGRLQPGEQEIAMTPVRWRDRARVQSDHGLTTGWPAAVERQFVDHIAALWRSEALMEWLGEPGTGDDWSKSMRGCRTVLPGGLEVYAVEHPWVPTGCRGLTFVLRDGATGRVSSRPLSLVQKWSVVGGGGPTAWWADLEGDGSVAFGLERRYHNGTVEDGRFIRWFQATKELEFELVHVSPLLDEVRGVSRGEDGVVRTRLLRGPEGALIHDQWFENPAYGVPPRAVGRPPVGEAAERVCRE